MHAQSGLMPIVWDEDPEDMMDPEAWALLFQCEMVDIEAERAIRFAEIEIRMEKRLLTIEEAFQRELAETEAAARQQE